MQRQMERCGKGHGLTLASRRAYTLVELLATIAIIAVLVSLLLPALASAKAKARQVRCVSNLRQVGLGFRQFATDHGERFPMHVPAVEGGTLHLTNGDNAISVFKSIQRELDSPAILVCPSQPDKKPGQWSTLRSTNVSYFVSMGVRPSQVRAFLSGDGNITNLTTAENSILRLDPKDRLSWGPGYHHPSGNIVFVDGHTEELSVEELQLAFREFESRH